MTYKYNESKKRSYRRDWLVIGLLYATIGLLLTTTFFAVKCYMLDGEVTKLERVISNEQ